MSKIIRLFGLSGLLILVLSAGAALADPPLVVGRISLAEGAVSLRHADDPQWNPGSVNYPVIAGDGLWTDQAAKAEVQIGGAEARLDGATLIDIPRLDDQTLSLRIDQGVLNLVVRDMPPGGITLVSGVGEMSVEAPGEYHVDAGRPGGPPTQLLFGVFSGAARFTGARGTVDLRAGQGAMVPPDQSALTTVSIYPTPFDQWAERRAQSYDVAPSMAYVAPDMTGYQDLGHYGRWEEVPDYGPVWYPTTVEIGWAPYRYGHWAYVAPWGWTWIDNAPWGFAPFHYGRWIDIDGRWAWIPGARYEPHCYSPALVAFVGGGPGVAGVVWVPLGPREVFHPWYPVSNNYTVIINRPHVTNVTVINQTNVNVHYTNAVAVTSVPAQAFQGGEPVHHNMAPVERDWERHPIQTATAPQLPAAPTPQANRVPIAAPQHAGPAAAIPMQPHAAPATPQAAPQPQAMPQQRPVERERPMDMQRPMQQPAPQSQQQQLRPMEAPRQMQQPAPQPQPQPQYRPAPQPQPQPQPAPPQQQYHPPPPAPAPPPQYHPQPQPQPQPQQQQQRPNEREKDREHERH